MRSVILRFDLLLIYTDANSSTSGSSIALGQLPPVSSTIAQSTGSGNKPTAQSLPPSNTILNVTPPAGVPISPTAPQSSSNGFIALRGKYCLQSAITSVAGTALGIAGVVYGVYSYQASVRANVIASHANELAMRESCRAHPVSHSIFLCLVNLIVKI
jgi:hypothetical protein